MSTIRFKTSTPALPIVAIALGCATAGGMRSAPLDAGVAKTFAAPYDRVLKAAREATVASGLAIESFDQVDSNTAMIVGKKGSSMWSYGELVRVVVQRADSSNVVVRVYTKRKLATNITAKGDYSDTIFQNIDFSLK